MMSFQNSVRRTLAGLAGAAVLSLALVAPSFAAQTSTAEMTAQVNGSTLTATVADAALQPVIYSNDPQTTTGQLNLVVNDARGTSAGWSVTIKSGNFVYGGDANANAKDIPNTGFAITSVAAPVKTEGQAIGVGGPIANSGAVATLDQARMTISADEDFGSGVYTQAIGVSLAVPALSQAGTYTATITVATTSAP